MIDHEDCVSATPLNTAVLFLVFNRPETTAVVFEAIRKAKPRRFYVAADGPREGCESEPERVAKVREIATAVDWDSEVKTLFRERNLGCGPAVKSAIDWFFECEEQGIVLEDDTIPTETFFPFCEVLLNKYRDDNRVAMIAGTNHIGYKPAYGSYVFSKNKACWGWATWRRAWENMDFSMDWRMSLQAKSILENMGATSLQKEHWKNVLSALDSSQVNTWDWKWYFTVASQSQLTIFPSVNLVSNIGFGDEATHTKGKPEPEYTNTECLSFPLVHPKYLCPDYDYDTLFEYRKMRRFTMVGRCIPAVVKRLVRTLAR